MESQIALDTALFLSSILLGFCFGLFFEIFRFLRLALPHHTLLVAVEDLAFFLPATSVFLLFTFACSDGVLRWFSVAGLGIGFFLYMETLGKILLFFSDRILRFLRWLLRLCYRLTLKPLFNVIKKVTFTLFTKIKKTVIIKKKRREFLRLEKRKRALLRTLERGALNF